MKFILPVIACLFILLSCSETKKVDLPNYGKAILPGEYIDQNGNAISQKNLDNTIFVTDFVFTHCPSICPKMSNQYKRIQDEFSDLKELKLLSFSIDPERDTIGRLKWYANKVGAKDGVWHFLRAEMPVIKKTSESLKVFQEEDENAPGGFNHQARFILVDQNGDIRGYYNGVDEEDVNKLIENIHQLK